MGQRRDQETSLTVVTKPTDEPITVDDAREQMKNAGLSDGPLVESIITTARRQLERLYGVTFNPTVLDYRLQHFPATVRLPRWPVSGVASISYVDTAGALQTLDAAKYLTELLALPALIEPAYGEWWPSTRWQLGAVTIRFTAGHTDPADTPEEWLQALKLLVTHMYDNRSAFKDSAFDMRELPFGVASLMSPWEVWL